MAKHNLKILPWQLDWLHCADDIVCLVGGFASGKTFIASNWFVDRCMTFPLGTHVIVGKDLPQLKRGTLQSLHGVLNARKIPYSFNSASGETTLENGCCIKPLSAKNFLSFRSLEADTIWADELADWGPSAEIAFTRYLAPRLRYSPSGLQYAPRMQVQMRITTNPPMSTGHWLYTLVVKNRYCRCFNVSLRDNYLMEGHQAYIDRQERSMSPDLWPLLIDGQWGNAGIGNVYKGFSRAIHCKDPQPPLPPIAVRPNEPLLWTLDFNVGMMCSVVLQHYSQKRVYDPSLKPDPLIPVSVLGDLTRLERPDYQRNIFYAIDELRLTGDAAVPEVIEEFLRRWKVHAQRTGVILYGDCSGGGRSQQISARESARSNWAMIVEALSRNNIRYDFRVPTQNPGVWDRINAVKSQLITKDGVGLFVDIDRCGHTVIDLESVAWREDRNEIDKDTNPLLTHLSDSLGYCLWFERAMEMGTPIHIQNPFST